jgi:hypothetical protein
MEFSTEFDIGQRVLAEEGAGVIERVEVDAMDDNIIESYQVRLDSGETGYYFDFQLEAEDTIG